MEKCFGGSDGGSHDSRQRRRLWGVDSGGGRSRRIYDVYDRNAHIDTAWQWPFEDTARDVLSDTFNRAVDALQKDPEAKFSMSASKHYEWVKEYYPELYEQVKELIASGQWDNPGGQVVERI